MTPHLSGPLSKPHFKPDKRWLLVLAIVLVLCGFFVPIQTKIADVQDHDCGSSQGNTICNSLCIGYTTPDGLPPNTPSKRYSLLGGGLRKFRSLPNLNAPGECYGGLRIVKAKLVVL